MFRSSASQISFLPFRLDERSGQLTQDDKLVPLRAKTWGVLQYLARRPGVLVSRDELLAALWPDVAVTPSTLTKSIVELRVALGDDAEKPRYIETVHRRGFRFIAPVDQDAISGTGTDLSESGSRNCNVVGREGEFRTLNAMLARAQAGERQTVFVSGPAGIGKTALIEAFVESLIGRTSPPVWIARAACVQQHGEREPYMPVLDALETVARRRNATRFLTLLRQTAPTWLAQMPWLLEDDDHALRVALELARPERMLRELAAFIEALTADMTLVVVLEDLHWGDPSTVDLLSFVAQRRQAARLLVICTYRPGEAALAAHPLASSVRNLSMRRQCTELALPDLSPKDVEQYLDRRFPGADFSKSLAAKIHSYTDGMPLFMVSVIDHQLRRGWIVETDPGWALTVAAEKLDLDIPDDLRQLIELELQYLHPADRRVLEAASVVGVEFAAEIAAAALDDSSDDVELRCNDLVRRQWFLRPAARVLTAGGRAMPSYAFRHELYRSVVYATIADARRRQMHQKVGEALEAAHGPRATDSAAALAVHFRESRDCGRVIRYLSAAAANAPAGSGSREAIINLEDALVWAARLPDEDERLRHELNLRLAIAPALNEVYGFASEKVRENCERADDLCARIGNPEQRFQNLYALTHLYFHRADQGRGLEALAELDHLASQLTGGEYRLIADSCLVRAAFHRGNFREACELAEARLPPLRSAHFPFVYGTHPLIAAHCHTALAQWMVGRVQSANELMRDCVMAANEMQTPFLRAAVSWFACFLATLSRDPAAAALLAEDALAICAEHDIEYWGSVASSLKGWVLVETGHLHEGIRLLRQARTELQAMHGGLIVTHTLAFEADAYRRLGQIDPGLAIIDEALGAAETTLDRSYWPELWRIKGELLLAPSKSGRRSRHRSDGIGSAAAEAEHCLVRALELARQTESKSFELRAATSLARLWHAQRRKAQARSLLASACQWFGDRVESVDLDEARDLLAALRHGSRPDAASRRANLVGS